MNRLSLVGLAALAATLAACGTPQKDSCRATGCSAGSVCNANSGLCELLNTGGGGGGSTGGGTGGGTGGAMGGGTGGAMGGGTGGGGGGVVVDPFEDGGTFVPGDICNRAIAIAFDGGTSGAASGDLSAAEDQYASTCSSSTNGADLLFQFTLTEPKGVLINANDTTSGETQDLTLTLISSPCPSLGQVQCADSTGNPETLDFARLPAGTWYVLVENYSDTDVAGTIDVTVDLRDPVAGPANDTCAMAQALTLTGGMAMVSGSTTGAINDTGAAELTCSTSSRAEADVFYSFTLTQAQDVRVTVAPTMSSSLDPAVAITTTCGAAGTAVEKACNANSPATALARNLQPGTYFIVVDGDSSTTAGDFDLAVITTTPATPPSNDTCSAPAPLTPNASVSIDANTALTDYPLSCGPSSGAGGDVVYQFTLMQPQKVTLTATGMNGADAVLSLRGAPCDMDTAERACVDEEGSAPEVLTALYVPAGTWYVVVQAYDQLEGNFGISLALDAPVLPPANDSCNAPSTLSANVSQTVDLATAATDYAADCSTYTGGDAVYAFTTTAPQRVVITVTGTTDSDAVVELRGAPCETGASVRCADNEFSGGETVTANNLPAGTYYVVLGSNGLETQFGITLSIEPARPITNDTCAMADVVAFTVGMATRSLDLIDAMPDVTLDCATGADGQDVVYSVTIPAMQTLTVVATPAGSSIADPVLALVQSGTCTTMAMSDCVDNGGSNSAETLTVPNTTASPMTVIVVLKGYDVTEPGEVDVTFALQ